MEYSKKNRRPDNCYRFLLTDSFDLLINKSSKYKFFNKTNCKYTIKNFILFSLS